jgi:hypothetical protein
MTADAIADGPVPDDAEELEEPREHTRLGQYRLVQRIGEGGMGVVHLALDRHGRAVALKVLRPHIALDPDARTRLAREVNSLSRVSSPFVAPIIDADVEGPRPYIVTRYVPGPSLDEQVAERGLLPPGELYRVAHGLAEALDAIHGAGVIHRDVKPANVLLVDGEPVLIDFGIAHVADDVRLTMAGLVMGTPGYLAPEVISGQDVTPATDWWGWAATTAFAAGGVPPFGRGAMSAVLARVAQGEPDLLAVDPRIEPLLYAALAPDPAQRPHHHEVVAALESYAHGAPATAAIEVRRVRPQTQVLAIVPTSVMQPSPRCCTCGCGRAGWTSGCTSRCARARAATAAVGARACACAGARSGATAARLPPAPPRARPGAGAGGWPRPGVGVGLGCRSSGSWSLRGPPHRPTEPGGHAARPAGAARGAVGGRPGGGRDGPARLDRSRAHG